MKRKPRAPKKQKKRDPFVRTVRLGLFANTHICFELVGDDKTWDHISALREHIQHLENQLEITRGQLAGNERAFGRKPDDAN